VVALGSTAQSLHVLRQPQGKSMDPNPNTESLKLAAHQQS